MRVSVTKFISRFGKHLALASYKEVIITKYGKPIVKVSPLEQKSTRNIDCLLGILPEDTNAEAILKERALTHAFPD